MGPVELTSIDLAAAAALIVLTGLISLKMQLGLTREIAVAGLRTLIQLLLIGFVLKAVFENVHLFWISVMSGVMLLAAGREITARQKRRFTGISGAGLGTLSLGVTAFTVTILALTVIVGNRPWYEPQYAIPLLGMVLGQTMNGIAVGLDRLTQTAWDRRAVIEGRLMLGQMWQEAIGDIRKESIRGGMIPIINSMSIVGLVSLPGMMTGQILSGTAPMSAVKYQILIMYLLGGSTGLGTMLAVNLACRRLFDERQRLRLDRLTVRNVRPT